MALLGQGTAYLLAQQSTGWQFDSANYDFVPCTGNNPQDLARGIGRQPGSGMAIGRALVNQLLPPGIAMVQTVVGVESNNFTTRQAIHGTLVNCMTIGDGVQVAGTFPAGALNLLGRTLRIRGGGNWGVTATPNITVDVSLGAGVLATTQVCTLSAVTTPQNFYFDIMSTVTTVGASGVMTTTGTFDGQITTITRFPIGMSNSTVGTGLTLDLTATQALSVGCTWSAGSASNRIRLTDLIVEICF
ncbi:MAG: hypothetical protein ACHRXM_37120 [Isosphaerales bacterium]